MLSHTKACHEVKMMNRSLKCIDDTYKGGGLQMFWNTLLILIWDSKLNHSKGPSQLISQSFGFHAGHTINWDSHKIASWVDPGAPGPSKAFYCTSHTHNSASICQDAPLHAKVEMGDGWRSSNIGNSSDQFFFSFPQLGFM